MAIDPKSTVTITYTTRKGTSTMESASATAATFASRMLKANAWISASLSDPVQQQKLNEIMQKHMANTHVDATPHLNQLASLSARLEKFSIKRLVTEAERNQLLTHSLAALKELGMSDGRILAEVSKVYPSTSAPAPDVKEVPVSVDPQVKAVFSGQPVREPERSKKGIFG